MSRLVANNVLQRTKRRKMNELKKQVTSVKISLHLKELGFTEPSRYFREWIGSKADEIYACGNYRKEYCVDNVNCYTADELGRVLINILTEQWERQSRLVIEKGGR
jgi:hypothetical protein